MQFILLLFISLNIQVAEANANVVKLKNRGFIHIAYKKDWKEHRRTKKYKGDNLVKKIIYDKDKSETNITSSSLEVKWLETILNLD